jgi:hypothetical protein
MIDDTHTRPQAALLLTNDVADVEELPYLRYTEVVLERGHAHLRALRFATEARLNALVSDALASSRGLYRQAAAFELGPGATAHVSVSGGVLSAELAASDLDGLDAAEEWVRGAFPQLVQDEARSVSVRFWSASSRGPRTFARTIAVPGWEEIDANYPASVRAGLEQLLASPPRAAALRALGWEWREWCDLHYVTDPERFFGESAYMLDVLLLGRAATLATLFAHRSGADVSERRRPVGFVHA